MKCLKLFVFFLIAHFSCFSQSVEISPDKQVQKINIFNYGNEQPFVVGDRIKLHLSKEVSLNGKNFNALTPVYAYTSYDHRGRVILDIENIEETPLNVIKTVDQEDGITGMYFENNSDFKSNKNLIIEKNHSLIIFVATN